jgi:hypothetical protein
MCLTNAIVSRKGEAILMNLESRRQEEIGRAAEHRPVDPIEAVTEFPPGVWPL